MAEREWSRSVRDLVLCADGFGGDVTGGYSGPLFWVTTLSDSGPGSLREGAVIHGSRWILFNVSGTICLSNPIGIASNKTIDGRGQRVVISCNGLHIRNGAKNIIINNLILWRGGEDGIQLKYGAQRVWINHVTIGRWGDGAIDVTRGSTDVTISRSLFHHHNKVMLVGSQGWSTYTITSSSIGDSMELVVPAMLRLHWRATFSLQAGHFQALEYLIGWTGLVAMEGLGLLEICLLMEHIFTSTIQIMCSTLKTITIILQLKLLQI
ncbi:hypothetical protein CLOM_g4284 [Closterium sp. NIES-68]|nr:hypothetical protein CLOM_g4284 [Closterium sp. NIES-68]GJP82578.1 hypothetical protein CLOP_g12819 [Closterium sp. NIES-67]